MIPVADVDATIQGNLDGEKIPFTIDPDSLVHLATVLSGLYGDIESSMSRELITNMLDSHIDAGQSRPVEVFTPTSLSPYVVFKDYGLGLSLDDMRNIYTKYGASTKRTSNSVAGSLGLGSKSPLAYTPSFTVTSVKDGVKILANVSLNEDGIAQMDIVDTSTTTEHNGVEIKIPAKRYNEFRTKIVRLARFISPGLLLIDGQDKSIVSTLKKVTDKIFLYECRDWQEQDYVVMGNVAYPCEINSGLLGNGKGVVAYVDMGSVNFMPNREGLKETERTKDTIARLREELKVAVVRQANDEIANAPSYFEAFKLARTWRKSLDYSVRNQITLSYKNNDIPDGYITSGTNGVTTYATGITWHPRRARHSVDGSSSISYDSFLNSAVIVNYPHSGTISSHNKAKIRKYFNDLGTDIDLYQSEIQTVLLFSGATAPGAPWTDSITAHDWNAIKNVKVNPTRARFATPGYSRGGKYDVFDSGTNRYNLEDVTNKHDVIYFSPSDVHRSDPWRTEHYLLGLIQKQFPNHKIVSLAKGRTDKMLRNVKSAMHVKAAYDKAVDGIIAAVTKDDIRTETRRFISLPTALRGMDKAAVANIKDADLRADIIDEQADRPDSITNLYAFQSHAKVRSMIDKINDSRDRNGSKNWKVEYPLLNSIGYATVNSSEVVLYLNAKYDSKSGTAAKEGK